MRYLQSYTIFEKSSLTALGVPNEVMRNVQEHYAIQADANWVKIKYKKDVKAELKKTEKALFIEISTDYIKIILNLGEDVIYDEQGNDYQYTIQTYRYDSSGWGGYDIGERKPITRTQMLFGIRPDNLIYKLDGKFQWKPLKQRKVQKEMKLFDETTNEFKYHMLYNFNNIIQRIYGVRYERVMKKIVHNIKNMSEDATPDEILEFLKDNKKMAEKAKEYEKAKSDEDLLRIKKLEKQFNSLPVLDEYLLKFEDGYSDKYHTRLSIKDLIDDFGRMKIETAFMFFLFTGKLKELSVQRKK